MRRLLATATVLLVLAGIVTAIDASADSGTSTRETFCIFSRTFVVAGRTITTPEICVPVPGGASS